MSEQITPRNELNKTDNGDGETKIVTRREKFHEDLNTHGKFQNLKQKNCDGDEYFKNR